MVVTVFAFSPNHFYVHVFLIVMLAIAIDILVPVRYIRFGGLITIIGNKTWSKVHAERMFLSGQVL